MLRTRFRQKAAVLVLSLITSVVCAEEPGVTYLDKGTKVALANGIVSFEIEKTSGEISNLRYRDTDILSEPGYFDWVTTRNNHLKDGAFSVVTDPTSNGGASAEISIAQAYKGRGAALDVELHYVLRRGESGVRVFAVFHHPKEYPAVTMAQSRWVLRVNDSVFETIALDNERRHELPPVATPVKEVGPKESMMFLDGPFKGQITDKYHHFVDAGGHFVHGWMGKNSHLGAWVLYGSTEDQNGGPTKQHNAGHFGRLLFKILTCAHYGAAPVILDAGEEWRKVYGPWMLYLNQAPTMDALYADAQRQAAAERDAWPAAWMKHPVFAPANERGGVAGQLIVADSENPRATAANAWVGLAEPSPDWQQQSKNYQYWVRANADGQFAIRNVRPGTYTLYAYADGSMGEFRRDGVVVAKGGNADLGKVRWEPERFGRQLWQIGTPDRTAREFRRGDDFRHWGLWLKYPEDFPKGVDFVIGKSRERTDWNYAQVNVQKNGEWVGTTWRVRFEMPAAPKQGTATVRVAFAGARRARLVLAINGRPIGDLTPDLDNAMVRAAIHGQYAVDEVKFDAALLRAGENTLTFEQKRGGSPFFNVMYDAVRMELDETTPFRPAPANARRKASTRELFED